MRVRARLGWVSICAWGLTGLTGLAACRDADAPAPETGKAPEVAGRMARLQEDEGDVLARRDELVQARAKVSAERAALEAKRKEVRASGGDLRTVDDEERALEQREEKILADERELARKFDQLIAGYRDVSGGAAGGRTVAAREAEVAAREKEYARREKGIGDREKGVADREAALAERERELARREKETCGAAPTIVQAPATAAAARYTKKDVEPQLAAARRRMSERGLLEGDLPAPARGLEKEATSAMAGGDFGRARLAADQLVATVESLKVDRGFIVAKINRLNGALKASKLSGDARKEADDLFRDATADYGDGKFSAANAKLNRIFAMVP
jgi:hypothetical protein